MKIMKIAILGAGAMGSAMGALLQSGGNDVTLIDTWRETVEAINKHGLKIDNKTGETKIVPIRATDRPDAIGPVDLLLVFVKCYHTEAAVRGAASLIGANTTVLSLQNGWGNGPRIASIVGEEKLLIGVCYHSASVLGPGQILHSGQGKTFVGELNGKLTPRLKSIAETFNAAGIETIATDAVLKEIWSKLALNVCTLPTSALLRFPALQLVKREETVALMRELLKEVVAVAQAQGIALSFEERWEAITNLLMKLPNTAKGSMLQDVEKQRRTEIDVINGAIMEGGERWKIPTPYNNAMFWMIHALENAYN